MNSLCRHCRNCKDYVYERFTHKGNHVFFQYCEAGRPFVELSEWYLQKDGYAYSTSKIEGHKRLFHTFFKTDDTMYIDHVDGDRADNRLRKLKELTPLQNNQNTHFVSKTSRFVGVHWDKKNHKWRAHTKFGKYGRKGSKHFGLFDCEEEAYHAYVTGLKKIGREVNTDTHSHQLYLEWLDKKAQTKLI